MQIIMYCGRLRLFCTERKPLHAMSAWRCTRTITRKSVSRITIIIVTLVVETLYINALCISLPYAMWLWNYVCWCRAQFYMSWRHGAAGWTESDAVYPRQLRTKKDAYCVIKGGLVSKPDLRLLLRKLLISMNYKTEHNKRKVKNCVQINAKI
jgi:hypothetical protein